MYFISTSVQILYINFAFSLALSPDKTPDMTPYMTP